MKQDIELLFRKYIDNELQPTDERLLHDFLANSEANRQLFNDFVGLYKAELQSCAARKIDTDRSWSRVAERLQWRKLRRRIAALATAAAAVLLIAVPTLLYMKRVQTPTMVEVCKAEPIDTVLLTSLDGTQMPIKTNAVKAVTDADGNVVCENNGRRLVFKMSAMASLWNKISVKDGSTYELDLFDGSVAHINSNSELAFPDNRSVSLNGEAYFEVKHNEHVPFTVDCGGGVRVVVLGTKFNVSARQGQPIVVTLASGLVEVEAPQGRETLSPGEQLTVSSGIFEKKTVNSDLYTSWAKGMYDFTDATMDDIMSQLSLWYGVSFSFETPALKARTYTGAILKYKPLGYTLDILKEVSNVDFDMQDGVIVVRENKSADNNI